MDDSTLLTIGMIIAITAFFKKQLGLTDKWALLAAFLVSGVLAFIPTIAAQFPQMGIWVVTLGDWVKLFLSAAGSYDFAMNLRTTTKPPEPGLG